MSVKFSPSSESLRASVLLLIPKLRATSSTSTLPCGSNDEIAFSTLVRSSLRLPFLSASDASQYFRRRSLRRGISSAFSGGGSWRKKGEEDYHEALVVRYQEGNR